MSDTDFLDKQLDLSDLWVKLQDLEDGSLPIDQRDALIKQLHESPAARRAYMEYFHQAAVLRMEADKMQASREFVDIRPLKQQRAWWARPSMALAAAITIAAFLWIVNLEKKSDIETMHAIASSGSVWEINGVRSVDSSGNIEIKSGDSVRVQSGTVKMEFKSGSIMVMQGPSQALFAELRKPLVQDGLLWVDTGVSDDAFEVSTPEFIVKDIGTRFGVKVSEGKKAEIHLFEGGVNLISKESGIELATLAPSGKGQSISIDGTMSEVSLAADPFPLLPSLLSESSIYRNTILSQHPDSYVKFDHGIDGRFDNEIKGPRTAKSGPSVILYSTGVSDDKRFKGMELNDQSLYFPGNQPSAKDTSVVAFLDGVDGISQKQGSISFWIKASKNRKQNQILWLASKIQTAGTVPSDAYAFSYLSTSGQLGFAYAGEEKDVDISSHQSIQNDQWHHIVITWEQSAMTLYLDGKQVAHRNDVPEMKDWTTSGNSVRFGKPTDLLRSKGFQNYHGLLDEFALWNRPLTPEEVEQQFQSAIGEN